MEFEFDPKKSDSNNKSMGLISMKPEPYGMTLISLRFPFKPSMNHDTW